MVINPGQHGDKFNILENTQGSGELRLDFNEVEKTEIKQKEPVFRESKIESSAKSKKSQTNSRRHVKSMI